MLYDSRPNLSCYSLAKTLLTAGRRFSKPSLLATKATTEKGRENPVFCGASFMHEFFRRLHLQPPSAMLIAAGKHLATLDAPGTTILFHEHNAQITVVLTGRKPCPTLSHRLRGLLAELNPQNHALQLIDQTSVLQSAAGNGQSSSELNLAFAGGPGDAERIRLYLSRPPATEKLQILNFCLQQLSTRIAEARHCRALEKTARSDSLSGLGNRRHFDAVLDTESARADRYRYALSLIMLDLDYFKKINDTFGHQTGDLVLREVGRVLANEIRASDIGCRYGGEEFAIILPETGLMEGRKIAERMRRAIAGRTIETQGNVLLKITASLGVASNESRGLDLVKAADQALYEAKQNGRNRVVVANENQVVEPKYFEIVSQARLC
ncbi:MAG: GGDEF domain-containing protein [Deltaproteobacteria bacterium]|nr:GGDEF domain-containing protein [Deltaproteobacteria bacterium]